MPECSLVPKSYSCFLTFCSTIEFYLLNFEFFIILHVVCLIISHHCNVPCALCGVTGHTNKIMIPSHYECPYGWRRQYYGYLMSGGYGNAAATQYTCVDKSLEQIPGSGANTFSYLFMPVEAYCDYRIPCSDKEVTCVVCTK